MKVEELFESLTKLEIIETVGLCDKCRYKGNFKEYCINQRMYIAMKNKPFIVDQCSGYEEE